MSTSYDVFCRTCNDALGIDEDHAENLMLALVRSADVLAQIGALIIQVDADWHSVYVILDKDNRVLNTIWFRNHQGHDLTVRNEYGEFQDECNQRIRCPIVNDYHRT
jgi:hypothetical protein